MQSQFTKFAEKQNNIPTAATIPAIDHRQSF
jgi:hypothetical protein